jgi:hypothetical protein
MTTSPATLTGNNFHHFLGRYQAGFDFAARETVRHAVEMLVDLDMVVDPDPAGLPLGEDVGLDRQRLQGRSVDLLQQHPPGLADPPDRALLIEPGQKLADRLVHLVEGMEPAMTEAAEKPALDDQHAAFHLGLVARAARPGRQDGGAIMLGQRRIGPIDLRIVEAGFDHRDLGIVRNQKMGHATDCLESPNMAADPIGQGLGPGRLHVGEVRCSHDGDEDLGLPNLPVRRSTITGTMSPT